jgi:tryptophan-rich sensory protein
VVRATSKAELASAKLAVRPRVDGPVPDYRGLRLACLAGAGFSGATLALTIFALQLVLNAAWTPLFFGLHRIDLGLLDIVLLWLFIIVTIILFYSVNLIAALLLLPYLGWVTFAVALNLAVWRLNRRSA